MIKKDDYIVCVMTINNIGVMYSDNNVFASEMSHWFR